MTSASESVPATGDRERLNVALDRVEQLCTTLSAWDTALAETVFEPEMTQEDKDELESFVGILSGGRNEAREAWAEVHRLREALGDSEDDDRFQLVREAYTRAVEAHPPAELTRPE